MSTLLYVHANPKPKGSSRTLRISHAFVEEYKKSHPEDKVIELDLYKEDIGFLNSESVLMHNVQPGEGREHPQLKYAYQFLEADKVVIAAPFWNLSFPAIIKAYLDYVTVSGITFQYTSQGPVGQCQGKKAIHIVTRGGEYSQEPLASLELGDRYLKTLFNFLGFDEYSTMAIENMDRTNTDVEAVLDAASEEAQKKARAF